MLRDAPGPEREEHRQHHGKLLRQDRHRQRQPREDAGEPPAARHHIEEHQHYAHHQADRGKDLHHARGLGLQPGLFAVEGREGDADAPELGMHAGRGHQRAALPLDHQRAGVHRGPGTFFGRQRFAGQQRFVHGQVVRGEQGRVGGHPVALGKQHQVAPHHLRAGDPRFGAIADDEGARAGEVAQRFERALGLALLDHRDHHHHDDRGRQDKGFGQVAENEVDARACDEQEEHRLAQNLERDR